MFQVESRAQMASLPRNHPEQILRPRRAGRDHPPRPHRRQDDAPLHAAPAEEGSGHLSASIARACAEAHARRSALSGAAAAHGHDRRQLLRRGSRRAAPRRRHAPLVGAHEESRRQAPRRHDGQRHRREDAGDIIENISSFALYGFPESHAASFALIAYASAYFKVKYLAAFTCAILNNQPMGFYMPAVLVKDAQRHGLRVKPIDVQVSDWPCTVEHEAGRLALAAHGLGYAKGLRKQAAEASSHLARRMVRFARPKISPCAFRR